MAIFNLIRSLSTSFLPPSASSLRQTPSRIFSVRNKTAASGYRALDRELPNGGWPSSVLTELLLSEPDMGELSLLKNALPHMLAEGKTLLLLASSERKLSTKLHDWNIALDQIVLIETDHPAAHMATLEQIMRDENFGALLCWLPEVRDDHLQRLHAAVSNSKGWAFLFRPLEQRDCPTPAMLRIVCRAVASTCLSAQIIKRRGIVYGKAMILPLTSPAITTTTAPVQAMQSAAIQACAATRFHCEIDHSTTTHYQLDRHALSANAAQHRAALRTQPHAQHII